MKDLKQYLKDFKLSDQEIDLVMTKCVEKKYKSNAEMPNYNSFGDHFYFIQQGMIRSYRIIDGNDITYNFFVVGEICGDYEAVLKQTASKQYFQAIVPTTVLAFNFSSMEDLFDEHPRIERIARKVAESSFLRLLDRVIEFQSETLEQRYRKLVDRHESILKDAPLQHIATYLGVKPQSLSRIRSKVVKKC